MQKSTGASQPKGGSGASEESVDDTPEISVFDSALESTAEDSSDIRIDLDNLDDEESFETSNDPLNEEIRARARSDSTGGGESFVSDEEKLRKLIAGFRLKQWRKSGLRPLKSGSRTEVIIGKGGRSWGMIAKVSSVSDVLYLRYAVDAMYSMRTPTRTGRSDQEMHEDLRELYRVGLLIEQMETDRVVTDVSPSLRARMHLLTVMSELRHTIVQNSIFNPQWRDGDELLVERSFVREIYTLLEKEPSESVFRAFYEETWGVAATKAFVRRMNPNVPVATVEAATYKSIIGLKVFFWVRRAWSSVVSIPMITSLVLAFCTIWVSMPVAVFFAVFGVSIQSFTVYRAMKQRLDWCKQLLMLVFGILGCYILFSWWKLRSKVYVKEGRKKRAAGEKVDETDTEPMLGGATIAALVSMILSSVGLIMLPLMGFTEEGFLKAGAMARAGEALSKSVSSVKSFSEKLLPLLRGFFSKEQEGEAIDLYFVLEDGRLGVLSTFASELPKLSRREWQPMMYKELKTKSAFVKVTHPDDYAKCLFVHKSQIYNVIRGSVARMPETTKSLVILVEDAKGRVLPIEECTEAKLPTEPAFPEMTIGGFTFDEDTYTQWVAAHDDGSYAKASASSKSPTFQSAGITGGVTYHQLMTASFTQFQGMVKNAAQWRMDTFPAIKTTDLMVLIMVLKRVDFPKEKLLAYAELLQAGKGQVKKLILEEVERKDKEKEDDEAKEFEKSFPLMRATEGAAWLQKVRANHTLVLGDSAFILKKEFVKEVFPSWTSKKRDINEEEEELPHEDEISHEDSSIYALGKAFRRNCCGTAANWLWGTTYAKVRLAMLVILLMSIATLIAMVARRRRKMRAAVFGKESGDFLLKYADGSEVPDSLMTGKTLAMDIGGKRRMVKIRDTVENALKALHTGVSIGEYPVTLLSAGYLKPATLVVKADVAPAYRKEEERESHHRRFKNKTRVVALAKQLEAVKVEVAELQSEAAEISKPELRANAALESSGEPACVHPSTCSMMPNTTSAKPCGVRCNGMDCEHATSCSVLAGERSLIHATDPLEEDEVFAKEAFLATTVATAYSKVIRTGNDAMGSALRVGDCGVMPLHFLKTIVEQDSPCVTIENGSSSVSVIRPPEGWKSVFSEVPGIFDCVAFPLPIQAAAWKPSRVHILPNNWHGKLKVFMRHLQSGMGMDTVEASVVDGLILYETDHAPGFCGSLIAMDDEQFKIVGYHVEGQMKGARCRGAAFSQQGMDFILSLSRKSPLQRGGTFSLN